MKKIAEILVVVLVSLMAQISQAGLSQTQSYRVSVTIPAVVGLNVPSPQETIAIHKSKDRTYDITREQTVRNHRPVILETIVLK